VGGCGFGVKKLVVSTHVLKICNPPNKTGTVLEGRRGCLKMGGEKKKTKKKTIRKVKPPFQYEVGLAAAIESVDLTMVRSRTYRRMLTSRSNFKKRVGRGRQGDLSLLERRLTIGCH